MKKFVGAFALLSFALAVAVQGASGAAAKPDTDGYNLTAHVSAAQFVPYSGNGVNEGYEILTVTIAGKHYQVQGPTSSARAFTHGNGLLNLGDYRVKLVEDTHKTVYESNQVYEFLLPDNSTRKFGVIGQSE